MPKAEKVDKVKELSERFKTAGGAVFTDFRGLTVKDAMELRGELRRADTTFAVVKNTLTKLAVAEAGVDEKVLPILEGPTAVAFMAGDPVAGAKALLDVARRFPTMEIKGALIEGQFLEGDQARGLATLDPKEVSVGKVAGMLQAPIARMVYLLQAPVQRIAYALAERGRQAT
jgi:large subunit ribosomal protein L10